MPTTQTMGDNLLRLLNLIDIGSIDYNPNLIFLRLGEYIPNLTISGLNYNLPFKRPFPPRMAE